MAERTLQWGGRRCVYFRYKPQHAAAIIRYAAPAAAQRAVNEWHNSSYANRQLVVEYARRG